MLYEQASKIGSSMPLIAAMCGTVGFFTFVTPFLLHVITKRYVTELNFNPTTKEYTAETINFFLTRTKVTFRVEDVEVPEIPGMFTSFLVKPKPGKSGKPIALFVDPKLFDDPTHYIKIMGYDKPIDFKFEEAQQQQEQKKWKNFDVWWWWVSGNKIRRIYVWLTIVGAEIAETIKLRKIGLCIYIISVYSFINILLFYSTEKIHFALFNINFNIILQ